MRQRGSMSTGLRIQLKRINWSISSSVLTISLRKLNSSRDDRALRRKIYFAFLFLDFKFPSVNKALLKRTQVHFLLSWQAAAGHGHATARTAAGLLWG